MALKPQRFGLVPAVVVVACVLAGAAAASAKGTAAGSGGQKKILRLGNPNTRLTPPLRNVAVLKKTFATKRNQNAVSSVLDQAGLTSITPQVLKALTEGAVQETQCPVGGSMDRKALRRGGRPDIVRNAAWAGKKPFDAYSFCVEEGVKIYNFVVPKACGNLTLANVTEKPLPECVTVAGARDCDGRQCNCRHNWGYITEISGEPKVIYEDYILNYDKLRTGNPPNKYNDELIHKEE